MARRDLGQYPLWVFYLGATKPGGFLVNNPSGGGSFGCERRWLSRHSPLWGCLSFADLPTPKIPRRSTARSFQSGSHLGKNTPERKDYIMVKLVVPVEE